MRVSGRFYLASQRVAARPNESALTLTAGSAQGLQGPCRVKKYRGALSGPTAPEIPLPAAPARSNGIHRGRPADTRLHAGADLSRVISYDSVVRRLLALTFVLLVASPAAGATIPHACGLLTNKEVAKALNAKIESRTFRDYDDHLRSCTWTSVPFGHFAPTHSVLTVQLKPTSEAQFEEQARRQPGAFRIKGLGQEAFGTPPGNVVLLSIRTHGLAMTVIASTVVSPLGVEEQAAKAALARL